jgi:intracellular septation protein A
MTTFVVLWVVDYLVPDTSSLLMWIEFLLYLSLHMWMVFTVLQKPYLNLIDVGEELVRRTVRTFRA